ncbi:MarR family winged helix-turn-helix transcriptional regulator [Streptomyces sp. NPDC048297]|uniref:MarR family winged helix-turn-helix transcriptional regulator n=1 Tax=Streptomyces sp. NPDC048297 TaxID=3365531 RepID=UPI00371FC0B8
MGRWPRAGCGASSCSCRDPPSQPPRTLTQRRRCAGTGRRPGAGTDKKAAVGRAVRRRESRHRRRHRRRPRLPAPGSRLWERVLPLVTTIGYRLDRTLQRRHDVSLASLMTLGAVAGGHPEPVTVGAMARRLGVTASSASRVLAQLERAGWVSRSSWSGDRRVSRVRMTEAGHAFWAEASHTLDRELDAAFNVLAFDERYAHIVARLCRGTEAVPRQEGPASS